MSHDKKSCIFTKSKKYCIRKLHNDRPTIVEDSLRDRKTGKISDPRPLKLPMLIIANFEGVELAENWVSYVKERGGKKPKGWKGGNKFLTVNAFNVC